MNLAVPYTVDDDEPTGWAPRPIGRRPLREEHETRDGAARQRGCS